MGCIKHSSQGFFLSDKTQDGQQVEPSAHFFYQLGQLKIINPKRFCVDWENKKPFSEERKWQGKCPENSDIIVDQLSGFPDDHMPSSPPLLQCFRVPEYLRWW